MSCVKVEFLSKSLRRIVPFTAVIPDDEVLVNNMQDYTFSPEKYKTLYLLHGYSGNENDWLKGSSIERLAQKYHLAIVMPAGENGFYLDCPRRDSYFGEYIGRELVQYTRHLFPLSDRREDTYIGGLSMGGYGAMRNGLKYYETFSKILSFSGAYIELDLADKQKEDTEVTSKAYQEDVFGNFSELAESDMDPRYLYKRIREKSGKCPSVFMTCGTEDVLLNVNRRLKDFFEMFGENICYNESSGGHDWDFWNKYLEDSIKWAVKE